VHEPQISIHQLQAVLARRRTRRAALLTAGVVAIDAMPGVHT
jgi:hypothetical protein